jgi:hypothetical protein
MIVHLLKVVDYFVKGINNEQFIKDDTPKDGKEMA